MTDLVGVKRIPRKIVMRGNKSVAMGAMGRAEAMLTELEEGMKRSPLNLRMNTITREVTPGVTVTCRSFANLKGAIYHRDISIDVIGAGGDVPKKEDECLCGCNFTVGYILEKYTTDDDLLTYYTVYACNEPTMVYYTYEYILANDFVDYEVDMQVILMPYNEFEFECCNYSKGATGCAPIISDKQENIVNDEFPEGWLTTYRIISLYPIGIYKWYDKT